MLVFFCVQLVQTNNNESNWREKKKKHFLVYTGKRYVDLPKKKKQKMLV